MALRRDDLTPDQSRRQEGYDRSWDHAQRALRDPSFRARLAASLERLEHSTASPMSGEEFLAQTEPVAK